MIRNYEISPTNRGLQNLSYRWCGCSLRFSLFTSLTVTSFTVFFLWLKYEDITAFDDILYNNRSAHNSFEDRQANEIKYADSVEKMAQQNCSEMCEEYHRGNPESGRYWIAPDNRCDSKKIGSEYYNTCHSAVELGYLCVPDMKINEQIEIPCPERPKAAKGKRNTVRFICRYDEELQTAERYNTTSFHENCLPSLKKYEVSKWILRNVHLSSLLVTVAAIVIFIKFKNLHSNKNWVHVHLFFSFVFNDFFFIVGSFWPIPDENYEDDAQLNPKMAVLCKAINVLETFPEVAKSVWVFIEAVLLHTLISNPFVQLSLDFVTRYALIGWTCSIIPTIGWAIQYYGDESENCLRKESTATFLTLLWVELPIYVIAATNFVLLMHILYMMSKNSLADPNPEPEQSGTAIQDIRKLTKATLVLVPLFGVHVLVSIVIPFKRLSENVEHFLRTSMLVIDSLSGVIVACCYCFLNDDVLSELRRVWERRKYHKPIETAYARSTVSQVCAEKINPFTSSGVPLDRRLRHTSTCTTTLSLSSSKRVSSDQSSLGRLRNSQMENLYVTSEE